jgi:hypothetical protein
MSLRWKMLALLLGVSGLLLELRNLAVMCQAIGRGLKTKEISREHPS